MIPNFDFLIAKLLKFINRPSLRNCVVDKTAKIGSGSNCIDFNIGRYSYIGKNTVIISTKIGKFCSIASYCSIGGDGHVITNVSTSPIFNRGRNIFRKNLGNLDINENSEVLIGNDVWIGEKVFIKSGVKIGDGAVIGAHSVVTHDIPAYAIVVGIPAKLLRYRFNEKTRDDLLRIQWWNKEDITLKKISKYFNDPEKLIESFISDNKK